MTQNKSDFLANQLLNRVERGELGTLRTTDRWSCIHLSSLCVDLKNTARTIRVDVRRWLIDCHKSYDDPDFTPILEGSTLGTDGVRVFKRAKLDVLERIV